MNTGHRWQNAVEESIKINISRFELEFACLVCVVSVYFGTYPHACFRLGLKRTLQIRFLFLLGGQWACLLLKLRDAFGEILLIAFNPRGW